MPTCAYTHARIHARHTDSTRRISAIATQAHNPRACLHPRLSMASIRYPLVGLETARSQRCFSSGRIDFTWSSPPCRSHLACGFLPVAGMPQERRLIHTCSFAIDGACSFEILTFVRLRTCCSSSLVSGLSTTHGVGNGMLQFTGWKDIPVSLCLLSHLENGQ